MVVTVGVAIGEQLVALSRPLDGVQEQEMPPDPVSGVEVPAHTVFEPEADAEGRALTVSCADGEVRFCPKPSVTTTSYVPESPATVGLIVSVSVVAPEIEPPSEIGEPFFRH